MSVIRNCAVNSRSSTGHFGALLSDLRGEGWEVPTPHSTLSTLLLSPKRENQIPARDAYTYCNLYSRKQSRMRFCRQLRWQTIWPCIAYSWKTGDDRFQARTFSIMTPALTTSNIQGNKYKIKRRKRRKEERIG